MVLVASFGLGACGFRDGGGGDQAQIKNSAAFTADETSAGGAVAAPNALAATGGSEGGAAYDADMGATALPAGVNQPRIVKNATLRIDVEDGEFDKAFSEVATIASAAGGFVASSTSAAGDGTSAGSITIRVPAEKFDEVRRGVRGLGELDSEDLSGEDVGGQLTDLEARLRNLRAQEEAIRALMAKATNVPETLQVQNQLGSVREQIEQLDAQRARLTDSVTFATITVQLSEPGAAAPGERSEIAEAFAKAVDGAEAVLAGVIVALGYLVPLLLVVLVAFAIGRAISRVRQPRVVAAPASAGEHGA
jgi:hypothetical protein